MDETLRTGEQISARPLGVIVLALVYPPVHDGPCVVMSRSEISDTGRLFHPFKIRQEDEPASMGPEGRRRRGRKTLESGVLREREPTTVGGFVVNISGIMM